MNEHLIRELPVKPIVPALATLPINVLLALGADPTQVDDKANFARLDAVSVLLRNLLRTDAVLKPKIWTPQWNADGIRSHLRDGLQSESSRDRAIDISFASSFLGFFDIAERKDQEGAQYEIVHCIGGITEFPHKGGADPQLALGGALHLPTGALRDALVRSGTRLFVLQVRGGDRFERFARLIVGAGGPAVLVVQDEGAEDLDRFFRVFYERILGNQPIEEAAATADGGPGIILVCGADGDQQLLFDGLVERLGEQLGDYSGLVKGLLRERGRLEAENAAGGHQIHELRELDSRIDRTREELESATNLLALHDAEGASHLLRASANAASITTDIGWHMGEGWLHTKFDRLVSRLGRPPGMPWDMEKAEYAQIKIFYGTNRSKASEGIYFGPGRSSMHFGECLVNVPNNVPIGALPRPSIWTLFTEHPQKHYVALRVSECKREEFIDNLRAYVDKCGSKQAIVFIHGFNVKFIDAVYTTAQIVSDLNFPGVAVAFSWPSRGVQSLRAYTRDETEARWTLLDLREFLELIAVQSGATIIHLLAHSMGNRALTDALTYIGAVTAQGTPPFNDVILTAPDIDADTFTRDVPAILPKARRVTLYASSNDVALKFSKNIHGNPRAGESGPDIVLLDGIDTIDVSSADTSFVGHSYYSQSPSVLSDIFGLIHGLPPPRQHLKKVTKGKRSYWKFRPAKK